jgi:hypothetical protein
MGGSLSGKTTLGVGLSRGAWRTNRLRSLCYDPFASKHNWGPQAWVTDEFDKFAHVVFNTRGFAVFWDEGTENGRERDNTKFFTRIRHNHPFFCFFGHDYATMLPVMRRSLTDVVLFDQSRKSAEFWANHFADEGLNVAAGQRQYQATHKRAYQQVRRLNFTAAQLAEGVTL